MTELVVRNLVKKYGAVVAVDDVSFTIGNGEFLTLLGPSGCGKSTTLAAVAGLERPTSGLIRSPEAVYFDGSSNIYLPPERRNFGLVFQSYALWPHLTVFQNLAFPLKLRRKSKAEQARLIEEVLALVEMNPYKDRYPHQLSGGQQQRVALARTLVYDPTILLLDEPLSNLDAKLRERARTWLDDLRRRLGRTTLYVTHDQQEALVLSDRIAVMKDGKIVQLGTPREIYETPADPFVADFIGTSSFLNGTLKARTGVDDGVVVELDDGAQIMAVLGRPLAESVALGDRVTAALRPDKLEVLPSEQHRPEGRGTVVSARVLSRSYLGARWQYQLDFGAIVKIETREDLVGEGHFIWIPAEGCLVFSAS